MPVVGTICQNRITGNKCRIVKVEDNGMVWFEGFPADPPEKHKEPKVKVTTNAPSGIVWTNPIPRFHIVDFARFFNEVGE